MKVKFEEEIYLPEIGFSVRRYMELYDAIYASYKNKTIYDFNRYYSIIYSDPYFKNKDLKLY